ncbi:unnamed protein product [Diatraea saccharalis]|uniref:Uncharacterized protein n=1 Tax=Diatraea saccharalis TaxID=40085 RepID=A0A9N9QYB9_9NEOP|nr:unnamed protein product [Diatraea saccharalis]
MPENVMPKIPQSPSPVARAGAGDISERELSRERHNMQTPTRVQPVNPKKQLFSAPVNKFTGKASAPNPNLARLRSCLDEYCLATPNRPAIVRPKAVSMEDLAPKRTNFQRNEKVMSRARSPGLHTLVEEQAAARVARFMVLSAWRRRRAEVSCSERLRMQVSTLKTLLEGDNCKLRLAMRELERLKQLLRDKDIEKALLERVTCPIISCYTAVLA